MDDRTRKRFEEIKNKEHFSLNKNQIRFQIQTNHFMLSAAPPIVESAQHYYNDTKKQTK